MAQPQIEELHCPECAKKFTQDITLSAKDFECPYCHKRSALIALRSPCFNPQIFKLSEYRSEAYKDHLYKHSVVYVYPDLDGVERGGSGTAIQIGDRLFIATVAHTRSIAISRISIVNKVMLMLPKNVHEEMNLGVVARYEHDDKSIDAAIFELKPDLAARAGFEPINLDKIHDAGTGNPKLNTRVVGYPTQYIISNKTRRVDHKLFNALSYGCETIEPSRWPAMGEFSPTPREETDLFVYFCTNDETMSYRDEKTSFIPKSMPSPLGMSGGGLWQPLRGTKDNEIWSPDGMNLIGIQCGWFDRHRFLKLVQIIHALKVIADSYPDLKDLLFEKFPRLRTLNQP